MRDWETILLRLSTGIIQYLILQMRKFKGIYVQGPRYRDMWWGETRGTFSIMDSLWDWVWSFAFRIRRWAFQSQWRGGSKAHLSTAPEATFNQKANNWGVPAVAQQKPISMRMWVWSLALHSGLRIQHYHELWGRLQMRLWSSIVMAVL